MTRAANVVLCAALSMLPLGGCASLFGVDVRYPEEAAKSAMLAAAPPRRVAVDAVTDRRMDRSRIGAKLKNGDAIVTRRPVPDIVREALGVELGKNGHAIVTQSADVVLTAAVEEFWLDAVGRNSTANYVGRVAIAVAVADGRSGDRLLTRRYMGIKRRQAEADSSTAWREVMEAALTRAMHDLATDPALVAALRGQSRAAALRSAGGPG